ncbi:MAG: deacylase [Candidatus Abyssobacteria bacterium SURF_5]|uniref:Deacylase n=1 Tax=Abyssobacteria bacterium (strain SURF_5) TaxID=2093360 RepID=A0A3A4NW93_ABYX5|nr:MAG: deacylase [Candidatus Abyssubacteria bacterium SURF_5]
MTISRKLKDYLDSQGISYEVLSHKVAYTAQETAAAQDVTGWKVAKSVVCYCDGKFVLLVLQAPNVVDFKLLKQELGCQETRLAHEQEMEQLFPEVELGAESPFGNLYDLPVYVDKGLAEMGEIIFNAGSHTESIRMRFDDYKKLVNPKIIEISKMAKV